MHKNMCSNTEVGRKSRAHKATPEFIGTLPPLGPPAYLTALPTSKKLLLSCCGFLILCLFFPDVGLWHA